MTGQLTDMGAAAQIFWPLWERLLDKWPEIVTATCTSVHSTVGSDAVWTNMTVRPIAPLFSSVSRKKR